MDPAISILLGPDVRRACDELPLDAVQGVFRAVQDALDRALAERPVFTVEVEHLALRCELVASRRLLVVTLLAPLGLH